MPLITVKTSDVGCRKPGCKRKLERTARHHRGQETLFINAFRLRGPKKTSSILYKKLCQRYDEFREEDTVIICDWHHCEIHLLYDAIIREDQIQRGRRLRDYTWPQAQALMKKLTAACREWEEEITPGVDPERCNPKVRFPRRKKAKRRKR